MTGEELVMAFHTEGPPTEMMGDAYFSLAGQNLSFRLGEAPFVRFFFNDWSRMDGDPPPEIQADIYAYASAGDYETCLVEKIKDRDWLYSGDEAYLPVDGLEKLGTLDLTGEQIGSAWYLFFAGGPTAELPAEPSAESSAGSTAELLTGSGAGSAAGLGTGSTTGSAAGSATGSGTGPSAESATESFAGVSAKPPLDLPMELPRGFYLAEFSLGRSRTQLLFQVTELGAYLAANEAEALLWVHDLSTGLGAADAEISVNGEHLANADASGVAHLESLPDTRVRLYDIRHGGERMILADTNWLYSNLSWRQLQEQRRTAQAYWNYLYVDKPVYRPGDTLYFFGLVAPRSQTAAPVREVTLRLEYYRTNLDIKRTCAVTDDVFQGAIELPVLLPGYYSLDMYV
jgi:hypothetical protein